MKLTKRQKEVLRIVVKTEGIVTLTDVYEQIEGDITKQAVQHIVKRLEDNEFLKREVSTFARDGKNTRPHRVLKLTESAEMVINHFI